ncbi:tRNA dimethylallyltransferase [Breznakia sp. PF5-3]|uniref:tRNA (adenosine(37)-N6)-dimethylallyltransferase MiaA n=1 Tax=unclassified Breznakia TaxID=2623764 RepID=UPI0024060CBB|nr:MULTISPECIES: tRNA (adenosine(37)-N6)-dimethylallyltransferase MiaA [unclassified Breznakia]MDF9825686.1 tRNA dimethylallyltransferase [Breznakia sp. PM6-1]MDF9836067.1 tRNA dimethylallyltransferase [Breznakia sp. PF5-3]MDF9838286.1 tRNA dimethylallyltransferase [Breznakia sp. PFB2-8]MDF9860318.1 tRNA dimethylallyltransferase [Breznakia sp. PH5-24]
MKKVLVIVGPTGVGKTGLSIDLAKRYNGEIISGDAYQCYKELTIGSAKILPEEMQGIKHYLVDMISYKEEYNVKIFQEKARVCIDEILAKGKLPIICGGTGLYIKSLLYDYIFHDEEIDEDYDKALEQLSNDTLYEKLCEVDEDAAKDLHPNNRKRVKRALMMNHLGHKKSDVIAKQEHTLLYDAWIVGLTMDRPLLYERINERVLKMMDQGLEQEVMNLITSEADFNLQSMQGIGYKEWLGYYKKEVSFEDTVALIQKHTRNFAKRQYTWFHNQLPVHWYDITSDFKKKLENDIETWLN